MIWGSKKKLKGITGGHLNSIILERDQIQHVLIDSNSDCLALTETWLTGHTPTTMMVVPGHTCFLKDRLLGKGGAVLVYLKSLSTKLQTDIIGIGL